MLRRRTRGTILVHAAVLAVLVGLGARAQVLSDDVDADLELLLTRSTGDAADSVEGYFGEHNTMALDGESPNLGPRPHAPAPPPALGSQVVSSFLFPAESALDATQGKMDGFFSQLPYKCHLAEVASVGD